MKKIYLIIFHCFLFTLQLQAQSGGLGSYVVSKEKQGDRLFERFAYQDALEFYQKAYEKDGTSDQLRLKIAESYRMLNKPAQAEKWYSQVEAKEFVFKPEHLWNYAEALSSTGKYYEAQKWYTLYQEKEEADSRVMKKMEGIEKQEELRNKNATSVRVELADFNTNGADFSPAYYQDKLIFVSGRMSNASKNLFLWDKSGFLDLYVKSPDTSSIEKFDSKINSAYHEGPVVFWEKGTKMIFTRNNYLKKRGKSSDGVTKLKLYFSQKIDSASWSIPEPLPFNSDEFSTGHPAISSNGTTLYFASDRPGGFGGTDLYRSEFLNGEWQEPVNMGEKINTEGNEMFPYLYQDQQLYFASNGHGGLGGLDVYGIDFSKGEKAAVINPGAPINSSLDDFGLILGEDGRNGYFSSNRPGGMGNDDVYSFVSGKDILSGYLVSGKILSNINNKPIEGAVVYLMDARNKVIKSLKTEANGEYTFEIESEEKYQIKAEKPTFLEGSRKFISSRSEGPEWVFDLYLAEEKGYSIYAIILEENTKEIIEGVQVSLIDNFTGEVVLEKITDEEGDFIHYLKNKKPQDRISFQIKLAKEGYLSKTFTYNTALKEPGQINLHELMKVSLNKIDIGTDIGQLIGVKPIFFDLGKSIIRPDAAVELNKIVAIMKENPNITIELGSHSDARGSSAANLQLSDKRAKASADYIIAQGIEAARIVGTGYGESEIINRCVDGVRCSEAEHQQNRRTEFKVTKF